MLAILLSIFDISLFISFKTLSFSSLLFLTSIIRFAIVTIKSFVAKVSIIAFTTKSSISSLRIGLSGQVLDILLPEHL